MNKIYKVIYSKVRQCYVVVSEIAKSHGRHTHSSVAKTSSALTATVLIALGTFTFMGTPTAQAVDSLKNNDFVGASSTYWYWDTKKNTWTTYDYKLGDAFNNRSWTDLPNYNGAGAKFPGSIAAGLYAQAGQQTITIGDRNAGQSKGSVFIGEHSGYNNGDNTPDGLSNNYVTAVGFQSGATGWGSIAIGSNAIAENTNTKNKNRVVNEVGEKGNLTTVSDDVYGIESNPSIEGASVALGYNAHAKDGNIAIGAYSQATEDSTTPYVSVGGTMTNADGSTTPIQRRITNVADGDADSDVATVGQMNKAIESAGATGWTLSTNGSTSGTTIKSGTRVDFSPAVDGKNGTADHSNVAVSNTGSNVKIGLNRNIVLGEATSGNGGSLNVYSDSTEASNLGNRVSIDGSTVSVNYGSEEGTSGTKRGVVLGVGEDWNHNAQGYIAFNNIDPKGKIDSTYLHSATDAPDNLKGRLVYSNTMSGTEYIANLDDGITFTGDVQKDVPKDYTQTPTKLNTTLNITGGAKTEADLTAGNIGVVSTPAAESADGTQNQASKLEIKLNKDLKGITSITSQSTTNSTGAKIELGENGTTISGGNVNVSNNKVTGLANGDVSTTSTDAITGQQLNAVKTDLTKDLTVNAGWGLEKENNTISLKRNLGNKMSLQYKDGWTGVYDGTVAVDDTCLILGGDFDAERLAHYSHANSDANSDWGAKGKSSVIAGGSDNLANGRADAVFGGELNIATGSPTKSNPFIGWNTVSGGNNNLANGESAAVFGGAHNKSTGFDTTVCGGTGNLASGDDVGAAVFGGSGNISSSSFTVVSGGSNNEAMTPDSTVIGGFHNATINLIPSVTGGGGERGYDATVIGGLYNYASGFYSLALGGGGYQYGSDSDGNQYVHEGYYVRGDTSVGIDGGSTGNKAAHSLAAGNQSVVTVANGTAIGYQATTDEKGTIAFGHDKDDISGYTVRWKQKATSANGKYYDAKGVEITKDQYEALRNPDYTFNDYSKDPTITENTHKTAAYNRLVKVHDGKNAHDAVVMEQLKPYTKSDASNIGSNLKTYTVGDDGETITEAEASADAKTTNENKWGAALGTGKVADPKATGETGAEKNGSQQLVTGGTVFNETRISAKDDQGQAKKYNYLDANNSAGKNLEALDSALETVSTTAGAHTALTVEGNTPAGTGKDAKTNEDVYAGKNILLHESKDENGKVTYDLKLAKDINIGKPGKNGEDGKIGIDGKDGHIGLNGSDGISVRGLDGKDGTPGKDGVTITGPKGEAGKDGIDGKVGISGTDGKDAVSISGKDGVGHIGLTGPAGTNGMNGADGKPGTSIDITVKNGYDGKTGTDGKDGVKGEKGVDGTSLTRIVYTDGAGEHQVATMEDGMKYAGDDAQKDATKAIAKKLNNTLDIIGGADSKNLTESNIGVNSTTDGKLKVQLAKDLKGITSISNQKTEDDKTTGAKIILGSDGTTTITGGDVNVGGNKVTNIKSALDGAKDAEGKDATIATATGDALKNAANLGDLQKVYNDVNAKADKASASHTALTVEGGTSAGTQDEKTKQDVYTGKNILLHESKDGNGKVTYDLKLAKDINIGKPGKNGEDGKIGIDGKDGHIGLNGSDGISVRGLDGKDGTPGKDGVTITGPKGEAGKDGIDGKVGISGTDGKDAVSISGKDGVGHIGLTGPAGTNGMNGADGKPGTSIDITVKNGYDGKTGTDGKDGVKGEKGVDGTSLTRIVYTDGAGEHQVATMEDGMKYAGDDAQKDATKAIAKKLNNTLDIIGGADSKNLTESNIGVNSTTDGKLKVQLAKDLKGITSISNQKTEGDKTTGAKITLGADGNVDVNGGKITNVGSGIEKDGNGKYTVTDQNKYNAANVGDVQNIVNDAKKDLTEGANGLNKKANVDASNIGTNLKNADGSAASTDAQKANAEKWGSAIGTGKIEKDNGQLVTGKTVYDEVRPTADGSYVKKDKTTGENLSALDTQVKTNADNIAKNTESIQNITNNMQNLSENAVKYDGSDKSKVTLGGKDGTVITNVKDGALSENSKDAVNGKQLYNEQKAREAADKAITEKVTNNTNEITKIKNGDFTDASKTAIHNIAKDAVAVVNGKNTTVTKVEGTDTTPTTYAVNVEGKGKVASGDTGLISGDTLYKEVHVDKDGAYIKGSNTVGQNLSTLDTGLKTTSDLIHTNAKGDTIQIGGNSTATKIDISGKDKDGKSTGRVITGVVSDVNDPNSAANVGYVNGITSASNEQIYHDMNMQYNHVENDISRAAAGSNALAALHPMQEFDPDDKAQFALGYGHYRNSNAGAVGAFYQPDENSMVNFGVSFGNGDAGINAGVTFKFGPGGSGHHALTKTQMAKVIDAQSKEIDELKKDNADKDKRIDALEQKMTEILAKLDKSKD